MYIVSTAQHRTTQRNTISMVFILNFARCEYEQYIELGYIHSTAVAAAAANAH